MTLSQWKAKIIVSYLKHCWKQRTLPLRYLYLNLEHLDAQSGIYSKHTLNNKIPSDFQLPTYLIDLTTSAEKNIIALQDMGMAYPFFLKPEWGQASIGVYRIESADMFKKIFQNIKAQSAPYICQTAAKGKNEYDLFMIHKKAKDKSVIFFSCTHSIAPSVIGDGTSNLEQLLKNQVSGLGENPVWVSDSLQSRVLKKNQTLQVNFINGADKGTIYKDKTSEITKEQKLQICGHLKRIGDFSMNRISVSANSLEDIISGKFEVIEMNLISPFPLSLLDQKFNEKQQQEYIKKFTKALSDSVKNKEPIAKNPLIKLVTLVWKNHKRLILSQSI